MMNRTCERGRRSMFRGGFDMLMLTAIVVLLAIVFVPAAGRADDDLPSTVSVAATSKVYLEPDFAEITAGYSAENADVLAAQKENSEKMDQILAAIKALGIDDKDVGTANFSIESVYSYKDDTPRIVGYRVNNSVKITVRDIKQTAGVINAVFGAGANQSYGLTFGSTKAGEAYLLALADAVKTAKGKAEVMAGAADMKLSRIKSMSERNNYSYTTLEKGWSNSAVRAAGAAMDQSSIGNTIMSGSLEVTAEVDMVFELK